MSSILTNEHFIEIQKEKLSQEKIAKKLMKFLNISNPNDPYFINELKNLSNISKRDQPKKPAQPMGTLLICIIAMVLNFIPLQINLLDAFYFIENFIILVTDISEVTQQEGDRTQHIDLFFFKKREISNDLLSQEVPPRISRSI